MNFEPAKKLPHGRLTQQDSKASSSVAVDANERSSISIFDA